jgi:hypothetical protein
MDADSNQFTSIDLSDLPKNARLEIYDFVV